jgi:hypothetical protein
MSKLWIFETFLHFLENNYLNPFLKPGWLTLRAPRNWTQRQNTRPTGGPVTPHVSRREREGNSGVLSSLVVRSPAKLEASREPPHDCEPSGAHGVASGARGPVTAVHGGTVARLTAGRPTPAKERDKKRCSSIGEPRRARCACWKGVRWSGEGRSTERTSLVSSVRAPMSNSREEKAYHGRFWCV